MPTNPSASLRLQPLTWTLVEVVGCLHRLICKPSERISAYTDSSGRKSHNTKGRSKRFSHSLIHISAAHLWPLSPRRLAKAFTRDCLIAGPCQRNRLSWSPLPAELAQEVPWN